jgi:ATP-dependent Lon protease
MHLQLPMLPLRDIVVFPSITVPLWVGRAKSFRACEDALRQDGRVLLVAQKDASVEHPGADDLYRIGVIATLVQHLALPDGKMKLLARGEQRARIVRVIDDPNGFTAMVELIEDGDDEASSSTPPSLAPALSLDDWKVETPPGSWLTAKNWVGELQRILEDDSPTTAERIRAASGVIGDG